MSWIWISRPNSERPIDYRIGQGIWYNVKDESRLKEEIMSKADAYDWQLDYIDGDIAHCKER